MAGQADLHEWLIQILVLVSDVTAEVSLII
jgi:hypothetical protein